MRQKILFEKQAEDKRVYNLNQAYWKKQLQSKLKIKFSNESETFKNIDANGKKIYDSNPIFTFVNDFKTKAIRIIQDDASTFKNLPEENDKYLISAWLDYINLKDERKVPELVIALFLTKETVEKAMKLIRLWLSDDLNEQTIDNLIGLNS